MIDELIRYNREFVKNKGYERYVTDKYPDKKIAILSCMDTRLTELLPAALGVRNGDVKIIKAKLNPDGSISTDEPEVGVSVTLDWKPGGSHDVEM